MADRNLLRTHLRLAWRETLLEDYQRRLINSERGLQVHFCHHLMAQFDGRRRRLFVEPCFVAADGTQRMPDLVVCNSQRIIGVVELKFRPRSVAHFRKDLSTLRWFASAPDAVRVANSRYRGEDEASLPAYSLAPDAVLCWAGVYTGSRLEIEQEAADLGRRFLSLHAITRRDEAPLLIPG